MQSDVGGAGAHAEAQRPCLRSCEVCHGVCGAGGFFEECDEAKEGAVATRCEESSRRKEQRSVGGVGDDDGDGECFNTTVTFHANPFS